MGRRGTWRRSRRRSTPFATSKARGGTRRARRRLDAILCRSAGRPRGCRAGNGWHDRLGPADVVAVARIRRLIRDFQPDIVETHTTKAGIVGRLAARLEGSPLVLHIYHGHVLDGHYYGAIKTGMARWAERVLARISDRLVAVSARSKMSS